MVKFDGDLIYLYSENSRTKINEISNSLKKSPQRLKYTLNHYEKTEIVSMAHCVFDYSYFGLVLFKVYFKGGYISEKDKTEIVNRLRDNPYVVALYELIGEFDLAIELLSPNPSRFNKELRKVASMMPTLNNYKVILNVVTHIYPKTYLVKNKNLLPPLQREIIVGGDRAVEDFNDNEMAILKNILINSRFRFTRLAKQSGLNIKTAISVFRNLRKRKIIKGFKYIIDTNNLGIYKFRLFLKLHNVSLEREKQLMDFMLDLPEVVQLSKTVGDWSMEVDIECLEKVKIRQLTIMLRERFKDLIETFNIIEFYQYYKRAYLPAYLFTKEEADEPAYVPQQTIRSFEARR